MAEFRESPVNSDKDSLYQGKSHEEGEPQKRVHKPTVKAHELFELKVQSYYSKLLPLRQELDELILMLGDDIDLQCRTLPALHNTYGRFLKMSFEYKDYLIRQNSKEAGLELRKQETMFKAVTEQVEKAVALIPKHSSKEKSKSVDGNGSLYQSEKSIKSSASVVLARQRAKLEAARTNKEFVFRESNLLKEKARLEAESILKTAEITATLQNLKAEQEDKVASVEYDAVLHELEDQVSTGSAQGSTGSGPFLTGSAPVSPENVHRRTADYILSSKIHLSSPRAAPPRRKLPVPPVSASRIINDRQDTLPLKLSAIPRIHLDPQAHPFVPQSSDPCVTSFPSQIPDIPQTPQQNIHIAKQKQPPMCDLHMSPPTHHSTPALPQDPLPAGPQYPPNRPDGTVEISKYLMKRELITGRLLKFGDKPEAYLSWKNTFKEVMSEIGAKPSEEVDLMVKWLGPKSSAQVASIKTSNAGNHEQALQKAWERMDTFYGSPERVEHALKQKLQNSPIITHKDNTKLYELVDTLNEVLAVMQDPKYGRLLGYLNTSVGIKPILQKVPMGIRNKWRDRAMSYKRTKKETFPPFSFFCGFIQEMAETFNDPGFEFGGDADLHTTTRRSSKQQVSVNKTSVGMEDSATQEKIRCLIHKAGHSLNDCRAFKAKEFSERRELLKQNGLCFRCCNSKHRRQNCTETVKCEICDSKHHCSAMHDKNRQRSSDSYGGEKVQPQVDAKCTEICGETFSGKSCAKIVQVQVRHKMSTHSPIRAYAILDEQSNRSLARKELFDIFDCDSKQESYLLSTCGGRVTTCGRISLGFVVDSMDLDVSLELPSLIECDAIPNNRQEIPTPDVAIHYPHLSNIASSLPPLDDSAEILLLIGRDMLSVHHVLEQRIGSPDQPYAQRLPLGWVIVGESCLDGVHATSSANVLKTMLRPSTGFTSNLNPCDNKIRVSECLIDELNIFRRTDEDNKPGMSIEDKQFLSIMDKEMKKDSSGKWIAPLPLKSNRPRLPNNRKQAFDRAKNLDHSLRKDPIKRTHFLTFMQSLLDSGHAEVAPAINETDECWYLPLFGVYHPQKKDRIRGVFDSSAKVQGISLNSVLMSGPDLMNSLLGVLLRFRREAVAVTADIEQMFYCFLVQDEHQKYLRFIWHQDNDLEKPLVDYHMKVHVFGNSPSPAVATYGLRRTADEAAHKYGSDVSHFVRRNFYVDDALSSHPTSEEAVDLLQRTRAALQEFGHLRLHKVSSNSSSVLGAFENRDLAKDLKDLELGKEGLPTQRSLGICWNLQEDKFTFQVSLQDKPFTRRGVLSTINSLFDPLGFASPVTIAGKAILREAMSDGSDWDTPLPPEHCEKWEQWKSSLEYLGNVLISRTYGGVSFRQAIKKDLCIFSDASETAIAAVVYLRLTDSDGNQTLGFVLGKAKLAPKHGHTIPRLELCAAVLATELYEVVRSELDVTFDSVRFFTDSKVVLGYIRNETKRFFTYVENRVDRIRRCSSPKDWNYVPTKLNPADEATRSVSASNIQESLWLNGPQYLCDNSEENNDKDYPLVNPDTDKEVRVVKTDLQNESKLCDIGSRFEHASSWHGLVRAISNLKHVAAVRSTGNGNIDCCKNRHFCDSSKTPEALKESERFILKVAQNDCFQQEIGALKRGDSLSRSSAIRNLDPFIDENGLLRVGGRLGNSKLTFREKNPIIVPKKHHVARLLVGHYHQEIKHQGRVFTEGAIRTAGYWIVGSRRLVNSYLQKCVKCLKLRGKQQVPKMADLPCDRLDPAPPFSYIGIDVFGPWTVITRRTRGGQAESKRWAVIFTCQVIRAVHIEVIQEMTSSSFINALRRFVSLRGEVKLIRSDCGTNFVGAAQDIGANIINIEEPTIKAFLSRKKISWRFNPPHASHMGGSWERLIGVSRKILDSLLLDLKHKNLTHEVLTTLMAEVCSIINARPLTGIPSDPDTPMPLTPSTLLTMKTSHTVDSFRIEDFTPKDLYKGQWRCVQHLANSFWKRWKNEFLSSLQPRQKWQDENRNVSEGDVVLVRDKSLYRNEWPMAVVSKAIPSEDGRIRKVEVRVGNGKLYLRPVNEVVVLVPRE